MSHTKGPWKVTVKDTCVVAEFPTTKKNTGHGDTEFYGGYLVCESISSAENARLIAAAPEMYEVLMMLNKCAKREINEFLTLIEPVLKKARGEK